MNKDKVYLGGYVVGHTADTLGYKGLQIQLENLDIVEIDENLVHKGINEPQKVTVPQFVADWIEKIKKELSLREAMSQGYAPHEVDSWLREMDQDGACLNQELFARAWFEGYEVETEKRYTVKVKGNLGQYLGKYYLNNVELTPQFIRVQNSEPSIFTKEELEQTGFGWVFDCPGIEIEEVE